MCLPRLWRRKRSVLEEPCAEPSSAGKKRNSVKVDQCCRSLDTHFIYTFLTADHLLFVSGLRLTFTRIILIVLTPTVFARLGKNMAAGRYRFVASDLFVPIASLWMFIGPTVSNGFDDALAHSGPIALEYLIAYMSTRVLLSGNRDSLRFIDLLCLIISLVSIDALLDTITGRYFTHDLFAQITGYAHVVYNEDSYRFGLLRACGPLSIQFSLDSRVL